MATSEECRKALESLTGRIMDLEPADRETHLVDRQVGCLVDDLGVTFITRLGPHGADPVAEADHAEFRAAQVRLTAKSDDLLALAEDPGSFPRAWLSGRLKVEASIFDLFRLRKLL